MCLENQTLPDVMTILDMAVSDGASLCGGVNLVKKLSLLRSIIAVGSVEKDVIATLECRGKLIDMRADLHTLRSSEEFPGALKMQFGRHGDSGACYFWVHCFGESVTQVTWSLFKREFIQHHLSDIEQRALPKVIRSLKLAIFKRLSPDGASLSPLGEIVHVDDVARMAARTANKAQHARYSDDGTRAKLPLVPWWDVATVAAKRVFVRTSRPASWGGRTDRTAFSPMLPLAPGRLPTP